MAEGKDTHVCVSSFVDLRQSHWGGSAGSLGTVPTERDSDGTPEQELSSPAQKWQDRLLPPLLLLLGGLTCLARSPEALLRPELYAEDGQVWFSDAYNHGWLHPLDVPHTGYLQTFPRLIADVGLLVPLEHLPKFFVVAAVFVQVLPAAFIISRRMATAVPRRSIRLLLAVIYLALPNSREVNANLTNAQWHLALLAVLVVLATPATTWWWRAYDLAIIAISGLTGPFCIALLPIAVVMYLARRKRWTIWLLIGICVTAAIQLTELATSDRGRYGGLGATIPRFVEILGGQVVGGSLLGRSTLSTVLSHEMLPISVLLLCAGTALVAAAMVTGTLELRLFNIFAGMVLAASMLTPVASITKPQWFVLASAPEIRYWFFATLALLVDIVWLASRSQSRKSVVVGLLLLVTAGSFAVREDWRYPPLPHINWGAEVTAFDAAPPGQLFVFNIDPPGWKMILRRR